MSEERKSLLDRALDAEERVDALTHELADVRSRLKGALGADPATAVQALGWISRTETAERLVGQILRYIDQRSLTAGMLPAGWEASARAQMKAAEISQRDQRGFDRPAETDFWTRYQDERGRQGVVKDDSGWMHGGK